MTTPHEFLNAGQLDEAIAGATAAVKAAPKDLEHRWLLGELLVLAGEIDRADAQFDTIMTLEPKAAVACTPVRQLLRAETARRQFFDEGRVPELLDGADERIRDRLEAFVQLRAGDPLAAGATVARAEIARPELAGVVTVDGTERSVTDFRDLDDITAEVFEVLTQTGKYYWIEMSRVESVEFTAPQRPLDLVWRPARMVVRNAFDASVHLPAVYGTLHGADAASRLGRRTEWLGGENEAVVGVGQRTFVVDGEDAIGMLSIGKIAFPAPA